MEKFMTLELTVTLSKQLDLSDESERAIEILVDGIASIIQTRLAEDEVLHLFDSIHVEPRLVTLDEA